MKTFTATAALAALVSTTYAATVTLKTTDCLQPIALLEFTIDTDKLVAKELKSVCGLELLRSTGVSLSSLTCQAFKDTAGQEPGSAIFNSTAPALIATNPVQEGSLQCTSSETKANGTVSITTTITASASAATAASAGTAIPTIGGNGTVSTHTGGPSVVPSATGTGGVPAATTGAASHVAYSVGAMAAAFAALLL